MTKVLVSTDFSEKSAYAVRAAGTMAAAQDIALVCLHVIEELDDGSAWLLLVETPNEIERQLREERRERIQEFCERELRGIYPLDRITYQIEVGAPTDEILLAADDLDASLLVVGTVGHGRIMAAFLGSTANQLVRQSDRPVLVVPPSEPFEAIERVLAPVDFSEVSRASLLRAAEIARRAGAKVTVLHAMGTPPAGVGDPNFPVYVGPGSVESLIQERQLWLDDVAGALEIDDVVDDAIVRHGDPATAIDEVAGELGVDLICMGSHGRRGLRRFLLGNTAERVLRRAPCPILVLHEAAEQPLMRGALSQSEEE